MSEGVSVYVFREPRLSSPEEREQQVQSLSTKGCGTQHECVCYLGIVCLH